MTLVSIILPAYNESGNIRPIYSELIRQIKVLNVNYEIIFVIDGCTDNTEEEIKELINEDEKVKLISLLKNYGHQMALVAGYHACSGDFVITMDSDMQHPPSLIPELVKKWEEGYNVVYTIRNDNLKNGIIKKWTSKYYYSIFKFFTGIPILQNTADFRLIDKKVVDQLKNLYEYEIFIRGMIPWFGFSETYVEYTPSERLVGLPKYTSFKRYKLALSGIFSFSTVPIRLVSIFGIIISFFAFFYLIYIIILSLDGTINISGYSSLMISILFLGGIQLISIGIIGEYIGKIFLQSKNRPRYIIKEKVGFE